MTPPKTSRPEERWFGLLRSSVAQGGWALADQILSSGTNFGAAILLARFLGPESFGVFALAFLTWIVAMSASRALFVQPYVVRAASLQGDEWRQETRSASGSVLGAGILAGAVTAAVAFGLGVDGSVGRALLALAALLPALMLQDFWRFAGFSSNRARSAFVNDAVWAGVEVCLLAFFWASGRLSAPTAIVSWGGGAFAGALVGLGQFHGVVPALGPRALRWMRASFPLGGWFGLESAIYTAGNQAAIITLGATLGPSAVGGIRSVANLFGPVQLMSIAGESVALPASARVSARQGRAQVRRLVSQYTLLLGSIVAMYALVLVLFDELVLRGIFGDSFSMFAPLVLPLAVSYTAGVCGSGASIGLRAMRAGRKLVVAQLVGTSAKLALVGLLVAPFGLVGGAWGLSIGSLAHSGALWLWFLAGSREDTAAGEGRPPNAATRAVALSSDTSDDDYLERID